MRRERFAVSCCDTGESDGGRETGERMAAGRACNGYARERRGEVRDTRNGKAVNISVKRERCKNVLDFVRVSCILVA